MLDGLQGFPAHGQLGSQNGGLCTQKGMIVLGPNLNLDPLQLQPRSIIMETFVFIFLHPEKKERSLIPGFLVSFGLHER